MPSETLHECLQRRLAESGFLEAALRLPRTERDGWHGPPPDTPANGGIARHELPGYLNRCVYFTRAQSRVGVDYAQITEDTRQRIREAQHIRERQAYDNIPDTQTVRMQLQNDGDAYLLYNPDGERVYDFCRGGWELGIGIRIPPDNTWVVDISVKKVQSNPDGDPIEDADELPSHGEN